MRNIGKYIIKKRNSPFFYIQLPGRPAKSTGIRWDATDAKTTRDNEKRVQQLRDAAVSGEAWALEQLGCSSNEPVAPPRTRTVSGPTLADWIAVWQAVFQPELSESSLSSNLHVIEYWIAHYGARPLVSISREDILQWRTDFQAHTDRVAYSANGRRLKTSNANTNQYIAVLSMMLSKALGLRAVRENGRHVLAKGDAPGAVYWLPERGNPAQAAGTHCCIGISPLPVAIVATGKHYTDQELTAIIAASTDPVFTAFLKLGVATGQREGDILDIRRDHDITPLTGVEGVTATVVFRHTKNGQPHVMPIAADTLNALKALPIDPADPEYYFGAIRNHSNVRSWLQRRMDRACKAAGGIRRLRIHWATRATACRRLAEQGWSHLEIRIFLNWESEAMVRRYLGQEIPKGLMERGARALAGHLPQPTAPARVLKLA